MMSAYQCYYNTIQEYCAYRKLYVTYPEIFLCTVFIDLAIFLVLGKEDINSVLVES